MPEMDEFLRLKEMDALLTQAKSEAASMDAELNRLKRREEQKAERQVQLKAVETEHRDLTHRIAEVDRQLSQHLAPEAASKLEETGLNHMIRQQELELLMDEHRTFLAGYEKTLNDLREEINHAIKQKQLLSEQAVQRAKLLEQEVDPEWLRIYKKVYAKNLAHGVFSRIENGHCLFCRGAVSRPLESDVEAQLLLKACPTCDRLFLPHKAVYG